LKKKEILLGLCLFVLGIILLAISGVVVQTPPIKKSDKVDEKIDRNGVKLFVLRANFSEGDQFRVEFAHNLRYSGGLVEPFIVYTNITDPSGNNRTEYVYLSYSSSLGWVTEPGSWNLTGKADVAGLYCFSVFAEDAFLVRATLFKTYVVEGSELHPHSYLKYPGVFVCFSGLFVIVFGFSRSKSRRVRLKV